MDLLVLFLRKPLLREAATDCLHDIVAKGMDPVAKTKLVESLLTVLDSAGILNIDMVGIKTKVFFNIAFTSMFFYSS